MKIECTGSYIELEDPVTFKTGDKIQFAADTCDEDQVYLHLECEGEHVGTVEFSSLHAFLLAKQLKKAVTKVDR
ncbi:hypothetical protein [Mycobacterium avium]|uniref:hypothetical protein n=1 Tax=Mycobacterium avium TaxID=1764 RepID=UPI0007A00F6C|nr:hypothetical protein [Mycobacterium avium]